MAGRKTRNLLCLRYLPVILVSVLLWVGVGMAKENEKEKKIFLMTEGGKAAETSIIVKGPGEFSVKIQSNPTTGYSWAVQKITDEAVVQFRRVEEWHEQEEGDKKQPLLGAPTYEILTFEALKPGKAEIHLKYRRPWEKDIPPIKTHKVYVNIESPG